LALLDQVNNFVGDVLTDVHVVRSLIAVFTNRFRSRLTGFQDSEPIQRCFEEPGGLVSLSPFFLSSSPVTRDHDVKQWSQGLARKPQLRERSESERVSTRAKRLLEAQRPIAVVIRFTEKATNSGETDQRQASPR
jgi:hypothetical protein